MIKELVKQVQLKTPYLRAGYFNISAGVIMAMGKDYNGDPYSLDVNTKVIFAVPPEEDQKSGDYFYIRVASPKEKGYKLNISANAKKINGIASCRITAIKLKNEGYINADYEYLGIESHFGIKYFTFRLAE